MRTPRSIVAFVAATCFIVSGCEKPEAEEHHEEHHRIIVTSPKVEDVTTTQLYVCQIHSCRHIEVCALDGGYLEKIPVNEGQSVNQGDLMFKILPTIYKAKLDSELAEADLARIEYENTKKLFEDKVVSDKEVALAKAKLDKALANAQLAQAELDFTDVRAPFPGIIDRLHHQQGSLIEDGDMLTTLSDNSTMWVYFNVPEARYLEYKTATKENAGDLHIELMLANGKQFNQHGKIGAIEADFNNETGNIAFRADFPNPEGLLRHGQTGTVVIKQVEENAVVIPQRATFEILAKRYVFVVEDDNIVHQHEIKVEHEMEDIFVIDSTLKASDKIVLEGIRQIRDGDEVEYEFSEPEVVLANLKYRAE
ncbi:efflux RND transporter periplasmic adaptor subunit [Aeoliella mucimassa]|uniref:Efflux pump periplasmic linker BepF n=1 Tax=Aeoliella mucimassa TaxID=2527972 RepID=A0A518APC6_9BACT|nr:efflux RND transporter periplasmic adaptor subunit [Aeoliella mucimassa]QDU56579.1 Efflux pump periplasmic linker BepF [Aeoliella mucimassa]